MKKIKIYKALWVSPETHLKIVRKTIEGKVKKSTDEVIQDLLKKKNENKM